MALLQPKLNLKVSQKQILTPGLVQMVSVLALNKLELADMITAELTENPVLEELDDSVPLLDEVSAREEKMERDSSVTNQEEPQPVTAEEKDPFDEIDFGSFFSEYLDPGLRTSIEMEESEKPSFENFLSKPTTLTDHLMWQLGSLHVNEDVYRAAELVIGNLNEEGYLTATDDELLGLADEQQANDFDAEVPAPSAGSADSPEQSTPALLSAENNLEPEISESNVAIAEEESAVSEATAQQVEPQIPRPTLVPPADGAGSRSFQPRRTARGDRPGAPDGSYRSRRARFTGMPAGAITRLEAHRSQERQRQSRG